MLVMADVPAGIGAASAIVTGLSSLVTGLPDDRNCVGNKVLAAKAQDLFERVVDREEELRLEQTTPYQLLRRFRYERSILNATSSTAAAVQPFWELPSPRPDALG